MRPLIRRLLLLCWLLPWWAAAQSTTPWREFRPVDGLADPFCTLVTVNPRGVVLVRHSNGGLSRLDGYSITNLPAPAGDFRVHEDRFGQIWSLHSRGLQSLETGGWREHAVPEIQAELQTQLLRRQRLHSVLPVMRGRVLVLLSDRLLLYEAETRKSTILRRSDETSIGRFNEIVASRDGGVVIAGSRGLARIAGPLGDVRPASLWEEFPTPDWARGVGLHRPQESDDGAIVVVGESDTDAGRRILRFKGGEWRSIQEPREPSRLAWPGLDDSVWLYSANGLFQMELRPGAVANRVEFPESRVLDAAYAGNGVAWLATPEGVFRYAPPLWRVPLPVESRPLATHTVANGRRGDLWFVQASGLLRRDAAGWSPFPFQSGSKIFDPRDEVWPMPDGDVLVDTEEGVERLRVSERRMEPFTGPGGEPVQLLGTRGAGAVFVASGSWIDGTWRLRLFDGTNFGGPELSRPPFDIGEPFVAFQSRAGDLWLGGSQGVAVWTEQAWREAEEGRSPERGMCFGETAEGRVWCGAGDRLWEFDGREWRLLQTGLERINAVLRASDGTMWVGASVGLFRARDGDLIPHGVDEGLPGGSVYALAEAADGSIWAGTSRGLAGYTAAHDPDPPRTAVVSFKTERAPSGGSILEAKVAGADRWRYTPATRLLFSHRLDNGPWSAFRAETEISVSDLPAGEHRLEVRTVDRNGNIDPAGASQIVMISLPWFEDPRLIAIGALGGVGVVFFAVLAWNRHRRLVRSYAEVEQLVTLRTEQLARANDQLLHSQKMNALGTLAAGVAHDFNNILSIIKGSAQIIQKNPADTKKIRTRADRLVQVADQGAEIVRALLGFSRTAERDLVRCSLNDVVQDTLKLFGEGFLKQVQVEFEPAPGLPETLCAKSQIQQILLNIVLNAADAMGGHGRLILRVGLTHGAPDSPVLAPALAHSYVTLAVRDFGTGIPADVLPRIFEPFFTTKALSQKRGTGLGLSMVYRMAQENGLGLTVDTVLHEGTTFTVYVPVPSDHPLPGAIVAE